MFMKREYKCVYKLLYFFKFCKLNFCTPFIINENFSHIEKRLRMLLARIVPFNSNSSFPFQIKISKSSKKTHWILH